MKVEGCRMNRKRRIVSSFRPHPFTLSKCCPRSFVTCIRPRFPDVFHFANYEFEFLIAGVEMGRDSYPGARTEIDDEVATNQLPRNCCRLLMSHRDGAASIGGIFWTRHSKTGFLRQLNQTRGLPHTLFANP